MKLISILLGAAMLCAALNAQAALMASADGKTVYDNDFNITWLADANYAKTSGYDTDGLMTWSEALGWVASLNAENGGVGHLGYNDWRLPTTLQPDATCSIQYDAGAPYGTQSYGYNCTGSEMGHLFYNELGGAAHSTIVTTHNTNYNLFSNVQSYNYWSGTGFALDTCCAWNFDFSDGNQLPINEYHFSALAVRSGQITAVPVPAAGWLLGSSLVGLIGTGRRRLALG